MNKTHNRLRVVALIWIIMLVSVSTVFAMPSEGEDDSAEFVILFDVSGSMNWTDPAGPDMSRVSTEGARIFGFLRPTFSETTISLVIYNEVVRTVLEPTNVRTEHGMMVFSDALDDINHDRIPQLPGTPHFRAWSSWTNIGGALHAAYEILAESTASRRGVLLFTDGMIEMSTPALAEMSRQLSNDTRDAFATAGIPIHTIGLNAGGFHFDQDYLEDLSYVTGGLSIVVTNTDGLQEHFMRMFAELFDTVITDPVTIEIPESGEFEYQFHIYGQAVKEANITITSQTPRANIRVTRLVTETGVDVLNDPTRVSIDSSSMITNIKLIEPMDGNWTIYAIGPPDTTVRITETNLFDISLQTTLADDRVYLGFGETLDFNAFLFNNERDIVITSTQIYEDAVSRTHIEITDPRGVSTLQLGTLNPSRTGFNFGLNFDMPGTHTIRLFLSNDRVSVVGEPIEIIVGNPVLAINSNITQSLVGEDGVISVGLYGASDRTNRINVLSFLMDVRASLLVYRDGIRVDRIDFNASELIDGTPLEISYVFASEGVYTFTATFDERGVVVLESDSVDVSVVRYIPTITSTFPSSITYTIFGGQAGSVVHNLSEHFTASDGRALYFRIEADSDVDTDAFRWDIYGDIVSFEFLSSGAEGLRIIVTDGNTDLYTQNVRVSISTTVARWLVVLIAVVAIAILIVGTTMFLIFRMRVRRSFSLRLSIYNDESGVTKWEREHTIPTLSAKKNFLKPFIPLNSIVNSDDIFPDDPPDELMPFINCVTLIGHPFSKGFWIKSNYKSQKTKNFTGTSAVTLRFTCPTGIGMVYTITFSKAGL